MLALGSPSRAHLASTVILLAACVGAALPGARPRAASPTPSPAHPPSPERQAYVGSDGLFYEPMVRIDALPLLDYLSVTGPAPWGEAVVASLGSGDEREVVLFARIGASWWRYHLAASGWMCVMATTGNYSSWTDVTASGPVFSAHDVSPRLEVELEARISAQDHASTSRTNVTCTIDDGGLPSCTRRARP